MITGDIIKKLVEVMDRTERVRNFVCTNCTMCGTAAVTSEDITEIFSIIDIDKVSMSMSRNDAISDIYNRILDNFTNSIKKHILDLYKKPAAEDKVNDQIYKSTKLFIIKVAKLFNMSSEDFVMIILLKK